MKHAKILAVTFLILAASLFTACGKNVDGIEIPNGMILSCDPKVTDYYLFVPQNWTVDLTTSASGAYYSNTDPSGVSMMVWELENTDTTLDDWWTINETDLQMVFQNYTLESKENTTVDGNYAQKYVYTANLGENQYKIMQLGILKNSKVYLFTYTSLANLYDSHLEDVAMITENIIIE